MESEDEIRRRTRFEEHEKYLIGRRLARRRLRIACTTVVVILVGIFVLLLILPHILGFV